jgi:hypothetical protein
MIAFQIEYAIFGGFVILAGLVMIIAYSLTNPWWTTHLGRMMVTYATAEICMSTLLMITVEFQINPVWFRGVWFGLQSAVGLCLCYQTWTIIRLHQKTREAEKSRDHEPSPDRS